MNGTRHRVDVLAAGTLGPDHGELNLALIQKEAVVYKRHYLSLVYRVGDLGVIKQKGQTMRAALIPVAHKTGMKKDGSALKPLRHFRDTAGLVYLANGPYRLDQSGVIGVPIFLKFRGIHVFNRPARSQNIGLYVWVVGNTLAVGNAKV